MADSAALQQWALDKFVEYAGNPRRNDHAVAQAAAAIERFGFRVPVLAKSDGLVIDGHLRLKAARKLGLATVPVMLADDMSDAQVKAFRLSVNKIADLADWDEDLLATELQELRDLQFDMAAMGFTPSELNDLIGVPNTGADPDDVPPAPDVPVSRAGDLWLLGDHRLLCGDSTVESDVARLLQGGVKPLLMVTDPPYGVEYDASWRARAGVNLNSGKLGKVENDDRADWSAAWTLFPGDVVYCWHAGRRASEVQVSLESAGFEIRSQIIWGKDRLVLSRGDYHWQHEPCWYAVRKGATGHWSGDRSQTTLWSINAREDAGHGHSTQKPVECMKRPIENNSKHGDSVYEPFSGSGTTLIAAEMTGRRCYAIEIAPQYVDVAILRWQQYTGKEARRAAHTEYGDSKTFEEIKRERSQADSDGA